MLKVDRDVSFSSQKTEWATPQWLFDRLNYSFAFTLDVCASEVNHKCPAYFTEAVDGLAQQWSGRCWMNPPYGPEIGSWMAKAVHEARAGCLVVALVPARTDTQWWHRYAMQATKIVLVEGRLKFGGAKHNAPFPSAILIYQPGPPTGPPILDRLSR